MELDSKNVLHVSINKSTSETKDETREGGWVMHRVERARVSGHRALRLPNTVDGDKVSARVVNGVLTGECRRVVVAVRCGQQGEGAPRDG